MLLGLISLGLRIYDSASGSIPPASDAQKAHRAHILLAVQEGSR
jgi:hypothetical protein